MLIILIIILLTDNGESHCVNNCHAHGICNLWSQCECFEGYQGYDCSERQCAYGPRLSDIASSKDSAHQSIACSGQGVCDTSTGLCSCFDGYEGANCGRLVCPNNCNNHGHCISLRTAAREYDGWSLNHTTEYSLWDADVIQGCQCDPGWSGFDCADRVCDSGTDPRRSSLSHEVTALWCICRPTCSGIFKLRFLGQLTPSFLSYNATGREVAQALMSVRLGYSNISAHSDVPIFIGPNDSVADSTPICQSNSNTTTYIKFRRHAGDVPALSFYHNRISGGSLFLQTEYTLSCDCTLFCNGSFLVSFDGEMSERLHIFSPTVALKNALSSMKTIISAGVQVVLDQNIGICIPGAWTNHSILLRAQAGNLPELSLWPSVIHSNIAVQYDSWNSTVLSLSSNNGQSEHVAECCGTGRCNRHNGTCECAYGWEHDPDIGSCGRQAAKSSDWPGIARCPGTVSYEDDFIDWDDRANQQYLYVSINPTFIEDTSNNITQSVIERFPYLPYTQYQRFPKPLVLDTGTILFNLSSNTSAGPLVIDQGGGWLFFADNNIMFPSIGRMSLANTNNVTTWLSLSMQVSGMTMDVHLDRRKLYWTSAGENGVTDGRLYWEYVDSTNPSANDLTATIGQRYLVDPIGIAVHMFKQRIYWLDKNLSDPITVLRSCDLMGNSYTEVYLYRNIANVSHPANVTDLKIDLVNNSVMFIDSNEPTSIVETDLDFPIYLNKTQKTDYHTDFYHVQIVVTEIEDVVGAASGLYMDGKYGILLWADTKQQQVNFYRYTGKFNNTFGEVYTPERQIDNWPGYYPKIPVGITVDDGMGVPRWGNYLDCYGHGTCLGLAGKWRCECFYGYYGDCQSKECPRGRAWFSEPIVDNIAHDQLLECSNKGRCDQYTGTCQCQRGFEGAACERMSCTNAQFDDVCNGNGRCLSMRDMAAMAKNEYGEPTPLEYGSTPHSAETWDADMIHGCVGDTYGYVNTYHNITTYEGRFLTELSCPNGYNTRTLDKLYGTVNGSRTIQNYTIFREIQSLQCVAINGSFSLKFRGKETPIMSSNTSVSQLQSYLMDLRNIGNLQLQSSLSSYNICHSAGYQTINITFLTELGKIPLLTVGSQNFTGSPGTVSISRVQEGSGELYECAGHGTCDRTSGSCICAPFWGSSNGFGSAGTRGDCGHNLIY